MNTVTSNMAKEAGDLSFVPIIVNQSETTTLLPLTKCTEL